MNALIASASIVALCAMPQVVAAQTGTSPFCLQTAAGARCIFMTMAACERARGDISSYQCITQADARGVTGLGDPNSTSSSVTYPLERR